MATQTTTTARNLAQLCIALNATPEGADIALTDLPTFGGIPPLDTSNVWSWDATRQIRQDLTGSRGFYIEDREELSSVLTAALSEGYVAARGNDGVEHEIEQLILDSEEDRGCYVLERATIRRVVAGYIQTGEEVIYTLHEE